MMFNNVFLSSKLALRVTVVSVSYAVLLFYLSTFIIPLLIF